MPRRRPPALRADQLAPVLLVILAVFLILWFSQSKPSAPPPGRPTDSLPLPDATATAPTPAEGYLYCTWNVENLFDDQDDPDLHDEDEDWFGHNPAMFRLKLDRLAEALLRQNGGQGPDILAIVEVENRRAVEALRDTLNARLPPERHYNGLVHRDNRTGRRIEPALLTRLRVLDGRWNRSRRGDDPHNFGIRRILEARLEADGAPLTILVSHWTSRVTDRTDRKRSAYADALYAAFLDIHQNDPNADVLFSGDFNDEPDDLALVAHLHTTSNPELVRPDEPQPLLLNLMGGRDATQYGTYLYGNRWQILDHIVASPGLLDRQGWQVLPETLRTENDPSLRSHKDQRPWRFGDAKNQNPRGFSDHFAVTVRLRVDPPGPWR